MKKFGHSKGSIKKATESAIKRWTDQEERLISLSRRKGRKGKSGVDLLVGLLADVKHKSSVEEQHNISNIWVKSTD